MKTTHSLLTIVAATLLSATSIAQALNCDLFTITSIEPDSLNANNTIINIQMAGNSNDFINYPFIPVVWDCNGDTVATGNMFFFGQMGQSTLGYPVTALSDDVCLPITLQFVYGDEQLVNDTCLLTFGGNTLSAQSLTDNNLAIYPNPTTDHVRINTHAQLTNSPFTLFDATGRAVLSGKFIEGGTTLSLEGLPAGVYFLRAQENNAHVNRIFKK
jgi:hypothetical protein